jgi:two-component system invasion response regulator UvrY
MIAQATIRVFVADDHRIVREGLRRILTESEDIEVVGEAATVPELFDRLDDVHTDVVLLDISMPGPGMLEALRVLRQRGVRTLILSMYPESQFGPRAIKAGAAGYLTKEQTPNELIGALRKVHEGRTYVSPALAEELAGRLGEGAVPAHELLSEREFQILLMLGSGKTGSEISRELSLSPKTVSTYRTRVLQKLGLLTTVDLVRYVLENDLG